MESIESKPLVEEELEAVVQKIEVAESQLRFYWEPLLREFEVSWNERLIFRQLEVNDAVFKSRRLSQKGHARLLQFSQQLKGKLEEFRSQETDVFLPRVKKGEIRIIGCRFATFYEAQYLLRKVLQKNKNGISPESMCFIRIGMRNFHLTLTQIIQDVSYEYQIQSIWYPARLSEGRAIQLEEGCLRGFAIVGEKPRDRARAAKVKRRVDNIFYKKKEQDGKIEKRILQKK